MRSDFFNEALVTAMLAASSGKSDSPSVVQPDDPHNGELTQADILREHLTTLMDNANRAAIQQGIPPDLVETADFAISVFIDETLLSSPTWSGRTAWMKKPLQFTRHDTATGGEDFYRLLDTLMEQCGQTAGETTGESGVQSVQTGGHIALDPHHANEHATSTPLHATLEIFALCLAQGFTGMYYGDPVVIQQKLQALGKHVPAVARCREPFFSVEPVPVNEKNSLARTSGSWKRFDLLDLLLWTIPPALTIFLYHLCSSRLDQLILPFLQGGPHP